MKRLPVFLIATILSIGSFAQTLIPKVGANLSKMAISDELSFGEDPKFKPGLTIGAAYEIEILDILAIQPELLFQQKGVMAKSQEGKITYNLNYLELPVMVKVKFGSLYLNAGPYLGYGLGGKAKFKPDSGPEISAKIKFGDEPENNQGDDQYFDNALDFGFQIGGGIVILDKLIIDLRYGHGLANLMDSGDGIDDNKTQNRSIQLTVGYPIRLK